MSIQFKPLSKEDRDSVHGLLLATYLDGSCYIFAIALHRALGWPIIGLMEGDVIRHAFLWPDGAVSMFDARGWSSQQEIGKPFGLKGPPTFRNITETDLLNTKKVSEDQLSDHNIQQAARMAQVVWPQLPWKEGTLHQRITEFSQELETLSRKYRLWICGPYETAPPIIREGYDDEKGYILSPLMVGGYTINRHLTD